MNSDCQDIRLMLPDQVDGRLSSLQQQKLDQHLNHCEDCSEQLASLWQMQALASHWQDQAVPNWQRRQLFFAEKSWWPNLQWLSSFASVLVLVLVLTNASIDTSDGLKIQFGESSGLTEAEVSALLAELDDRQSQRLDDTVATLNTQQAAANQLLIRTILDRSRSERKEELNTLLTVWDYAQDQRNQKTQESLSVLFASQVEDKRDIDQINRLLRQASLEGSNL
ncbi:MAG: zf-HC2 domain-containing protein [Pseudomonadales bacterium]|jgi:hypothetical protein